MTNYVITTGLEVEGYASGRACLTFHHLSQAAFHRAGDDDDLDALATASPPFSLTPDQLRYLHGELTRLLEP